MLFLHLDCHPFLGLTITLVHLHPVGRGLNLVLFEEFEQTITMSFCSGNVSLANGTPEFLHVYCLLRIRAIRFARPQIVGVRRCAVKTEQDVRNLALKLADLALQHLHLALARGLLCLKEA